MSRCTDPTCTPVKHDRSDHLEPEGTELGRFWDGVNRKRRDAVDEAEEELAFQRDMTHFMGDDCPGGHL